jgi:pantoate--beta-alanine ligase
MHLPLTIHWKAANKMKILTTIAEAHAASNQLRMNGTLGLVPTMGALHAGHLSLVAAAKKDCAHVAVSIFVNPLQFAPTEDFARYPRTFDADRAQLEAAGVDLLFAPSSQEMVPAGSANTFVEVPGISNRLDGQHRPGHFRGVATIVAKLFHILTPHRAYFGQKDAAQLAVLRAMVQDLNLPIDLIACPTVREPDGLAMSSRNRYLTPQDRSRATILYRSLLCAAKLHTAGEHHPDAVLAKMLEHLAADPALAIEYADLVDPNTLLPVTTTARGALLAIAARFGATRLIDNILLEPAHVA